MLDPDRYALAVADFAQKTQAWVRSAQALGELAAQLGGAADDHPLASAVVGEACAQLQALAARYPGFRQLFVLVVHGGRR